MLGLPKTAEFRSRMQKARGQVCPLNIPKIPAEQMPREHVFTADCFWARLWTVLSDSTNMIYAGAANSCAGALS